MKKAEYIRWTDSGMFHDDGWEKAYAITQRKHRRALHVPAESIGFVIHEDRKTLVLSPTHDRAHDNYFGGQFIAKKNIVKRRKVRV